MSLESRVISDFISIIVDGAFSTFYLSIQKAAAVSRAFHMVLIGLSYTGNNSVGKCMEQAKQRLPLHIFMDSAPAQQQYEERHINKQNELGTERQDTKKLQS